MLTSIGITAKKKKNLPTHTHTQKKEQKKEVEDFCVKLSIEVKKSKSLPLPQGEKKKKKRIESPVGTAPSGWGRLVCVGPRVRHNCSHTARPEVDYPHTKG
jgi:hypothetical protein